MTAAIILAGGRASRLGGAAKPLLEVDGRSLLYHAIAAVSWCDPIVVVGPPAPVHAEVVWVRESPPFGGPVAALAAGLQAVTGADADVYVLSADLPRAGEAVSLLRRHPSLSSDASPGEDAAADADGVCLTDADGRMQWLLGRYRIAPLRAAVAALPDGGRDASIRALVATLTMLTIPGGDLADDVDTWDDLERARAAFHPVTHPAIHPGDAAPEETPT